MIIITDDDGTWYSPCVKTESKEGDGLPFAWMSRTLCYPQGSRNKQIHLDGYAMRDEFLEFNTGYVDDWYDVEHGDKDFRIWVEFS